MRSIIYCAVVLLGGCGGGGGEPAPESLTVVTGPGARQVAAADSPPDVLTWPQTKPIEGGKKYKVTMEVFGDPPFDIVVGNPLGLYRVMWPSPYTIGIEAIEGQALYLSAASLSSGPFPQGGTTVRIVGNSDVMAVTQAAGTATATVSVVCCLNVPPPHYP